MKYIRRKTVPYLLALVGGVLLFSANMSYGAEAAPPLIPGVTTGVPLGALPPPGLYFSNTFYNATGHVFDEHGHKTPIKVHNYATIPAFLWSSPYRVFGARYGAAIAQPIASHGIDTRGVGGRKTRDFGAFNTILTPAILSWQVSDSFFVSTSQSFYLDNGDYHTKGGATDQTSYATGYWTYEPSVAVSYLHDGWDVTGNLVYDFNARNHHTDYKSGQTAYFDLTAARSFGPFTAGLLGSYARQTTDDELNGDVVGDGNRVEHTMVGAMAGYQLGAYDFRLRYMQDVHTRADLKIHITYLTISTKL